ncbi:MAG: exodeoxyribonuclease VII large subunit [Victivallaceae bacterium]|nr:exodeoxyribonuclease VII large subunit [Victivallaceae bacterium]
MDETVWSVTEVNAAVRDIIENSLTPFWMAGEIGTINVYERSGHVYLTLKDESCQIRATWFGGAKESAQLELKLGDRVEAFGKLTVYPVRGEYQFNIRSLRPAGRGGLLAEFERIKRKLEAEGVFAPERKKPLPKFPRRVGLITAPEGAAVRDFIRLSLESCPSAHIRVKPAAMQGANAVREICAAIDFFNRRRAADVIVICRGGGSIEDLWPFNDEILARKVAASTVPVVSAIGHEIDFTICDFAADFRAPTPSAAASAVFGAYGEVAERLTRTERDIQTFVATRLEFLRNRLTRAENHYALREPRHLVELRSQQLDELERRAETIVMNSGRLLRGRLDAAAGRLNALSPRRVLERGFAMVTSEDGRHLITSAQPELLGKRVKIDLASGSVGGIISNIIEN